MSLVIVDYGSGNLRSVQRAMERTGADVFLSLIDLGFREQALEYAQGVKA